LAFSYCCVTPGALASGALNSSNLFGANVIVQAAIAANAIGADQIAAGAVVAGKILANSITAAKIDALAINAVHINANAVEADKINAGAVTAAKIDANAVTADKINAGAITGGKILATDTFTYQNSTGSSVVKIGGRTITTPPTYDDTPGISVWDSSGASLSGWAGGFGGGNFEVGADYLGCYLDFYKTSNSISMSGDGGVTIYAATGGITLAGSAHMNSNLYLDGSTTTNSTSSRYPLYWNYNGSINRVEPYTGTSSRRYKTDISSVDSTGYLDYLANTNPVTFKYKKDHTDDPNRIEIGFIAEELVESEGFIKALVDYDFEGNPNSIRYFDMHMVLVLALKDAANRINELEKKVKNNELGL
jgi:hypothetical protein